MSAVRKTERPEGTERDISTLEARIKYVHDRGVEHGKIKAVGDRLSPNNPASGKAWEKPYEFDGPFGHGIDDIMFNKKGEPVILEYKGGSSELSGSQMQKSWVCRKISELKKRSDPMATTLETSMAQERLTGRVYRTPVDEEGNVGETFREETFPYAGTCK